MLSVRSHSLSCQSVHAVTSLSRSHVGLLSPALQNGGVVQFLHSRSQDAFLSRRTQLSADDYRAPKLTLLAAKRILAPHLFPLSTSSPWQQAKQEFQADKQKQKQQQQQPQASKANSTPAPIRRSFAFLKRLTHHYLHRLSHLLEYGLSSEGNQVEIFFDGDQAFAAMFDAVAAAKHRVCIETFMWTPDRIGLRMIQLLEEAADRGCQVLVLYDDAGSFSLFQSHLAKLINHPNAHVVAFNPVLSALFRVTKKDFSFRTHRKILIADNVGFAGGMNTGEKYGGPQLGINTFRDTHMRIVGPGVNHLAEVFFQSLQEAHAHDRATWKKIFKSIRTRAGSKITESSLFNKALEIVADSGTKSGQRAALFFEATRERQRDRLKKLEADELNHSHIERAALLHESPASHQPISAENARRSLRSLRRFLAMRVRQALQAGSTPENWQSLQEIEAKIHQQWRHTWRKIRKAVENEDENATEVHATANRPLPSSAMASLASSLSRQVQPAVRSSDNFDSVASSSSSDSSIDSSSTSSPSSAPTVCSNVFLQVLPSNTLRQQYSIQHALIDVLDNGLQYILITNPFLLPPRAIKNAIIDAGKRGVTVKIIAGGKSDTPFMRWSSQHIYHQFLAIPTIEIYEYQPRILHAKTMTIDGLYSSVGSFNLDFLSSHKLLEINIGMLSNDVSRRLEQQFTEDLKSCIQITKDSLKQRTLSEKALHFCAYHVSRLIYSFLE